MKKALVLTNHLVSYSGSEITALEVAETLHDLHYSVRLHCNLASRTIRTALRSGITISDDNDFPNIFDHDFVWSQHALLPVCLAAHSLPSSSHTIIVSCHLSPYDSLEMAGLRTALALDAIITANSPETASRLVDAGVPQGDTKVFHNACPDAFSAERRQTGGTRATVAIVSNHIPAEVLEARKLLRRRGVRTPIFGRAGRRKRVLPSDLAALSGVITIGKTCQYCIKMGIPVYCYDRFGGPGWLSRENFQETEDRNFSGRSSAVKKSAQSIADEIVSRREEAALEAQRIQEMVGNRYSLEEVIRELEKHGAARLPLSIDRHAVEQALVTEAAQGMTIRKLYRAKESRVLTKAIRVGFAKAKRVLSF